MGTGSRQYCRYTKSPLGITPLKEIWEFPWVKENLASVGFEPTTSGLDLPMLYRLSYEVSTGAGRSSRGRGFKPHPGQIFFDPWELPNFFERGNTQGGFGVSAVLPTSGTQTYIKNNNFLFPGCYAVPLL